MILTQDQLALENSLRRILPADIVSLWIPDGYNRTKDIIRSNHGQCYGTHPNVPVLPNLINPSIGWVFGGDDYVSIPSMTISRNSGAISFWVYTTASFMGNYDYRGVIIGISAQYSYNTLALRRNAPTYGLWGETSLNEEYFVKVDNIVPGGQWNHIEVSFDSGVATTYLNTVQIDQQSGLTADWILNRMGYLHAQIPFTGYTALTSVYSKPQSQAQVNNNYLHTKGLFSPRG